MLRTPAHSAGPTPEPSGRAPKTPRKHGKRKRSKKGLSSRAVTPQLTPASRAITPQLTPATPATQAVSPSGSELSGIDHALAPSRDATPPPRPHKSKWGERKSALSKEYIDDSEGEEGAPTSPTRRVLESDNDVALERAGLDDEEGDSEASEVYSDDEVPAYPPTEPIKPPPSTMPLVALSQVSDLPDIPFQAKRKRRTKMTDTEYEIFLRKQVASQEDAEELLSSRWLSPDDIRRLEATGLIAVKRGKFLEAEKRAMREHLKTFQAVHKVSDQDLVDLIMSKGRFVERSPYPTFWFELAAEVPGRPVKSVVDATKRMYDPRAGKGMWLPSEDRALLRAQDLYPSQWTKVSEVVDRSEHDCRDRWRELRDAPTRASGPWSPEEETALRAAVKQACAAVGRDPGDGVPWDAVVELMGRKRTSMQCRQKWKGRLVGGDFVPSEPHNTRLDRRHMLRRLREMGYAHEADITWTELPTEEWVVRPALLKNTWSLLRRRVPGPERREMPLNALLDRIEAGLDAIDAAVGKSGASRSAAKRTAAAKPTRAKRMKTKAQSVAE